MDSRLLKLACCVSLFWLVQCANAHAQTTSTSTWQQNFWQRLCSSLDMDFYNDRYYINHNTTCDGTAGTFYTAGSGNTGVQNFIAGTGATFTRAGTNNVTDTNPPFYLNTTLDSFVSRASVTNNVTSTFAPFFISTTGNGPSQSFVSRASSGTYFDSTGTLQTKASGSGVTAQRSPAYYYNGSAWVLGGTLIEAAATNSIANNTMSGGVVADGVQRATNGTFNSCSGATCSGWTTNLNGGSGSVGYASNTATLTGDGTNAASIYQQITGLTSGYTYTFSVTNGAGNAVTMQVGSTLGGNQYFGVAKTAAVSATSNYSFTSTGTSVYIQVNNTGTTAANITIVSLQSAGKFPTNWRLVNNDPGLAVSLYATGTENGISYTDWQIIGTASITGESGIYPSSVASTAATIGQTWTSSFYIAGVSGTSNLLRGKVYIGGSNGVSGVESSVNQFTSFPSSASLSPNQYLATHTMSSTASAYAFTYFAYDYTAATTINAIVRLGMPQMEQSAYATSVISTSSVAVTRSADIYNQQPASYFDGTGSLYFAPNTAARDNHNPTSPYADLGTLIEPTATNSIRNNMMVGAVAADGIERTNNGTFSTSGSNVCSGSDTSGSYSLSCSNGTAITAQTISSITYSGTAATVTTALAHALTVGAIVTVTGATPASYNGAYMVVSVPSSTTFTYTMASNPGANASPVGSYTATSGGWAGTLNGGTGTATGASGSMTLTGDGTNAASIYEAITTISGYTYTIVVTNGAGNAVTVQAGTTIGGSNAVAAQTVAASLSASYQFTAGSAITYVQINNSSGTAASVTTVSVQSAGEFPTSWVVSSTNGVAQSGIVRSVIGTGTASGISYVDLKFIGTSISAGQNFAIKTENVNQISSTNNTAWTNSVFVAVVGGSTANISSILLGIDQYSSVPAYLSGIATAFTPTSTLTRYSSTATTNNASVAYVQPTMYFTYGNGAAINITLRIGMPQLEQSSYTTSAIPTFGSAVTRMADVYSVPSGGTYFNGSGLLTQAGVSVPRLDHNPVSPYLPLGLLMENNSTNLSTNSANFSGYANSGSGTTTTANATTSPDGTTDATLLSTSTSAAQQYIYLAFAGAANTTYTQSIFAKAVPGSSYHQIEIGLGNTAFGPAGAVYYGMAGELNNCTVVNGSIGVDTSVAYTAQALSNGWCRFSVSGTSLASPGTNYVAAIYVYNGSSGSFTGDGTGIYIFGAQVEATQMPTSYIPTVGSAVTRSQDVFTVPGTAGGGSGWLTNNVGTFSTVGSVPYQSGAIQAFAALDDGTNANDIFTGINANQKRTAVIYASGNQYTGTLTPNTSYTLGNTTKIAFGFSAGFEGGAADNGAFADGAAALPTTQNRLNIGAGRGALYPLDGWVQRVWYMPTLQADPALVNYTQ